jgi:hypothetical protein
MYDFKSEPMSPEQIAQQEAQIAAQDAAIAKRRAQNRLYGTIWMVVGGACLAIGAANILTGAELNFGAFIPLIGGAGAIAAGFDQRRRR